MPVYLQIEGQVKHAVAVGGTYVADYQPGVLKSEIMRRLRPLSRQLAVEGAQIHLTTEEVVNLLEDEMKG